MEDYEKYRMQKVHSKSRGIEFNLTFDEWITWWKSTGKYHLRGKNGLDYCMCRKGDTGPYSLENIYCATNKQNAQDAKANGKIKATLGFTGRTHTTEARKKISENHALVLSEDEIASRIEIYNSIDFTKRGALTKFSKSLGLSHTQAKRFINRYITGY